MNGLKTLADTARAKREAATLASDKAFGGLAVPGVGSEAWRALWDAARHYSDHVAPFHQSMMRPASCVTSP